MGQLCQKDHWKQPLEPAAGGCTAGPEHALGISAEESTYLFLTGPISGELGGDTSSSATEVERVCAAYMSRGNL